MIQIIAAGLWVICVVLGAAYGAAAWKQAADAHAAADVPQLVLETIKIKPIIVPIIGDGDVKFYVRAQLAFTVEPKNLKSLALQPEPYVVDETFRAIYAAGREAFAGERGKNLDWLVKSVLDGTNARYGKKVVEGVLVQELQLMGKTDVRSRSGH